ncbi:MAG: nitrogen assimilation response regulator NtrX [Alphaproteobacteria bacterium]
MSENILIVDDESDIRTLIQAILEDEGYKTRGAANAKQAYEEIAGAMPDLVILDIWLQGSEHDGLQILDNIKAETPNLPVLMISGHGTIETAVSSIRQGAYDFIEKPFKADRLLLMIRRALENAELRRENESLRKKTEGNTTLVGESPAMQSLIQILNRVAPTNSRVLITGEPGTGKDIAARYIHSASGRAGKPFLAVNCASLNAETLEMELFGSAAKGKQPATSGLLERAHGGTLLLDEVADMPPETQAKIMRVLQEQKFRKLNGGEEIEVDVRILSSTNRDLEKEIAAGSFRQDLFFRLNVVPVEMPPLKKRAQDIEALAAHFVEMMASQAGLPRGEFMPDAIKTMQAYPWSGNIRQLRNTVEWVLIMHGPKTSRFNKSHLPPAISVEAGQGGKNGPSVDLLSLPLREAREAFERKYLAAQVERFEGSISKTAQFVGMERSALHRKLKSLNIGEDEAPKEAKAG